MKTSRVLLLPGAISCLAAFLSLARAGNFFCSDSKHPSLHCPVGHVFIDYGKFEWPDNDEPSGALVDSIVVSIPDQRLYVYRARKLLAWSNISSGCHGHETPTGIFNVSEKDIDHHSSLYENASMPYFMRLTDDGMGMHGGFLPGYPASHGCVRLPLVMARKLYEHVAAGTPVRVTSDPVKASFSGNKSTGLFSQL